MKKHIDRAIIRLVIATGISSVVTQLLTIREVLAQFQGNEIVIALVLFNWLCLGGLGTLLARVITRRLWKATIIKLGWLSLVLCGLSALQIPAIRELRNLIFISRQLGGFLSYLAVFVSHHSALLSAAWLSPAVQPFCNPGRDFGLPGHPHLYHR